MVANTNAPFGFSQAATVGGPPNFRVTELKIGSASAAIYFGDPVIGAAGYVARATAPCTSGGLSGIFYGCTYFDNARKQQVWNNFWPAVTVVGDVTAFICDDPQATFIVQAGATTIGQASVGSNVNINMGTPNSTTGISGAFVETVSTTATQPLIVAGLVTTPPGANGTDIATAYNKVVVGFNSQTYKAGRASV